MALPYYVASRPIIAAHRGLSSLFPENTIEGFIEALQWSDFIELDVVLSKEGEVIVCHDSFLSLVSNVANLQQFQNRKHIRNLYGKEKEDWWISDFTLVELKELCLRQCILKRSSHLDGTLKIPTLREVILMLQGYNQKNGTKKGMLLEIKDFDYHFQYCTKNISEPIMELLTELGLGTQQECAKKLPIVIMSFDQPILRYFKFHCNIPLAQLIEQQEGRIPSPAEIAEYAQIIGLDMKLLWSNDEPTHYYKDALENGLTVYGWTFQDDNQELKELFKFQEYGKIYQVSSQLLSGCEIYLMKKQLIAAHRGLSSLYPENTLEGLLAALPVADYVEFDVVLNKNLDLLVCHDTFLSRISDIANHPKYADKKCKRVFKDEIKDDWWISDFTTDEIQELKLHQCILKRKSKFDNQCSIPLLQDVLLRILDYNVSNSTQKGILLEMKDHGYHQKYMNKFIGEYVFTLIKSLNLVDHPKLPIKLMAFDAELLTYSKEQQCQFPLVQLIRIEDFGKVNRDLNEILKYAKIIGADIKLLWDKELKQSSSLYQQAKELGFTIYGWTFQDDNEEKLKYFGFENAMELYNRFDYLDGWITEFPQSIQF